MKKGPFAYDVAFLQKHATDTLVLQAPDSEGQIAVVGSYQGRVMSSSSAGRAGHSYGWLNYELIASGEQRKHINPFGGEDRFWLGPEGGQYALFFPKDAPFTFEHWQTPPLIDTAAYPLLHSDSHSAHFRQTGQLINYQNTRFDIQINRQIQVFSQKKIEQHLGISLHSDLRFVAFESQNSLTNIGAETWTKEKGLLSIWILGMFPASPQTQVIIPIQDEHKPLNTSYFGDLDKSRLHLHNNTVFFKGDGNYRSKIGIPAHNTKPICGSYDPQKNLLTIVQFSYEPQESCYVNSLWEWQKEPYQGDVVNAYNDGVLDASSNTQLGKFYEIETSSPAKCLAPNETLTHTHRTFHFEGSKKALRELLNEKLKVEN